MQERFSCPTLSLRITYYRIGHGVAPRSHSLAIAQTNWILSRSLETRIGAESDISQVFEVDNILWVRVDILGNRQGENADRLTLTTFHLPIQIIDPLHGLYVADLPKISLGWLTGWRGAESLC